MKMRGASVLMAVAILLQAVPAQTNRYYPSGRAPLLATRYVKLPFGAVRPQGWLNTQLNLQANAMTGHVDEFYSPLSSLSGTNRTIEYLYCFYEGQMALAYLMNNSALITKASANVTYIINSQAANGSFLGTTECFDHVALCRGLVEFYEITNDSRVIPFLRNYFRYVRNNALAGNMWSQNRTPEHIAFGYWLYNRTGDTNILPAIQTRCLSKITDWRNNYNNFTFTDSVNPTTNYNLLCHNVNIGHALKYALYHLQSNDTNYKQILYRNALTLIDRYHGQVGGRFSADENYTGKQPTRGMETCGIAEMSFSLEQLFEAYGEVPIADRAEFLMLNCWTGCNTADMWGHQYDQQANQIKCSNENRPWNTNTSTSNLFGREPNWPCCLCNVHHAWPRYIEHLWMATQDNGLVAAMYGPCQVTALVAADTATATIIESTEYPFDGRIGFRVTMSKTDSFPISFRIPAWENNATVQVGTSAAMPAAAGTIYTVRRRWQTGDSVTVNFPMSLRTQNRWNNSISVMRGPLWYSLKIGGTWIQQSSSSNYMGSRDWGINPTTAWNIGLKIDPAHPNGSFTVVRNAISNAPFASRGEQIYLPGSGAFTTWTQDPPVVLRGQGRILTGWTVNSTYPGNANDPPTSPLASTVAGRDTSIELIPYGSARLRVSEFPWISTPVAVLPGSTIFKEPDLTATAVKNGKLRFTVKRAGHFDVKLLDIAGKTVYRYTADGPKSFVIESGALHTGTYVAHIVSDNRKYEKKILIVK